MNKQRKKMYEIKSAILGFEEYQCLSIEKFDAYLATIVFEKNISINIINSKYLNNVDFELNDDFLKVLNLSCENNFEIYYTTVIQSPIKDSVVNLGSPIIINEKEKLIGQFVSQDSDLFTVPKLSELSTLLKP